VNQIRKLRKFITNYFSVPESYLVLGTFLFFFLFVLLSNYFDWDFFYSITHVERNSWAQDLRPPYWSYQFCGGITRIGDPQSFAFSPLFLFPLLFKTFWGLKILFFISAIIGYFFARKIFDFVGTLVAPSAKSLPQGWPQFFALSFIFSNFYLHHIYNGHITFALIYYALGVLYLVMKILFDSPQRKEVVWGSLCLVIILTAGYYPAVLYALVPSAMATLLVILIGLGLFPQARKRIGKTLGYLILLAVVCLLIAAYRINPTITYQLSFPRLVNPTMETLSLKDWVVYNLFPTISYRFLGFISTGGIWEKSFFSLNNWVLILLSLILLVKSWKKKSWPAFSKMNFQQQFYLLWLFSLAAVYFMFLLGNAMEFSFFRLLNKYVLVNSVREVSRFFWGGSFLVFLLLATLPVHQYLKFIFRPLVLVILVLFINLQIASIFFGPFYQASLDRFRKLWKSSESSIHKMNQLTYAPISTAYGTVVAPAMYPLIMRGQGIFNCYIYLGHVSAISKGKFDFNDSGMVGQNWHFIDTSSGTLDPECLEKNYYTQNDLFIHLSCPSQLCLNINNINIYQESPFQFDHQKQKFCRP
jgi:hypothetical protein